MYISKCIVGAHQFFFVLLNGQLMLFMLRCTTSHISNQTFCFAVFFAAITHNLAVWKIFASPCFWRESGIKMTNGDRQRQTVEKHRLFCTLLCSWSISTISDSRLESASCSNLSGAFWGDSMCCRREVERWRNYTKTWLTDFGPGLGFTLPDSGLSGQKRKQNHSWKGRKN